MVARRRAEADEFYAELTPAGASADEALVMRQAFAGLLWSKQFYYYYDVARWLEGDPAQPRPPASRLDGRNARWRTFSAFDILSMPDKWEYPWFAAWDLAFHCVALAHVDAGFAKYQLRLLCREWFQHPNGALPAYEWDSSATSTPARPRPSACRAGTSAPVPVGPRCWRTPAERRPRDRRAHETAEPARPAIGRPGHRGGRDLPGSGASPSRGRRLSLGHRRRGRGRPTSPTTTPPTPGPRAPRRRRRGSAATAGVDLPGGAGRAAALQRLSARLQTDPACAAQRRRSAAA